MRLLFKQRLFSWLDSYDIYFENGSVAYTVQGRFAWGHKLEVSDCNNVHVATLKQVPLSFPVRFEILANERVIGSVSKKFAFFSNKYTVDFLGWDIDGDFFGFDYEIVSRNNTHIASISKELFNFTDTYIIDVFNPADALSALMVVLAIDAANCSD